MVKPALLVLGRRGSSECFIPYPPPLPSKKEIPGQRLLLFVSPALKASVYGNELYHKNGMKTTMDDTYDLFVHGGLSEVLIFFWFRNRVERIITAGHSFVRMPGAFRKKRVKKILDRHSSESMMNHLPSE